MRLDAARTLRSFACGGRTYRYYSVAAAQALGLEGAEGLPFCLKVVLENLLRQQANMHAPPCWMGEAA